MTAGRPLDRHPPGIDPGAIAARGPVLAIDTATGQAGIAVGDRARVTELSWPAGRSHTTAALGQIHRLLQLHGIAVGDLAAVAVAVGPGSFTGLRVGLGLAKGLAMARDIPIVGVSTLDATALPLLGRPGSVVAVVPAGRRRMVWAPYAANGTDPRPQAAPRNTDVSALAAFLPSLPPPVLVAGEIPPSDEGYVVGVPGVVLPPEVLRRRRPAAVLALALSRLDRGESDDLAALDAVYLGR